MMMPPRAVRALPAGLGRVVDDGEREGQHDVARDVAEGELAARLVAIAAARDRGRHEARLGELLDVEEVRALHQRIDVAVVGRDRARVDLDVDARAGRARRGRARSRPSRWGSGRSTDRARPGRR